MGSSWTPRNDSQNPPPQSANWLTKGAITSAAVRKLTPRFLLKDHSASAMYLTSKMNATIPLKVGTEHRDFSYHSYLSAWTVRLSGTNSQSRRSVDSSPQPSSPGAPTCKSGSPGVKESGKCGFQVTATHMQCVLPGSVTGAVSCKVNHPL